MPLLVTIYLQFSLMSSLKSGKMSALHG